MQRCLEDRELHQARSEPDTVDQPIRTARTFVHHYNSTQYCNTATEFLLIFPSSRPTSHHRCGQMEVRGPDMKLGRCVVPTIRQAFNHGHVIRLENAPFCMLAAAVWNSLPDERRQTPTVSNASSRLIFSPLLLVDFILHFLSIYFDICTAPMFLLL